MKIIKGKYWITDVRTGFMVDSFDHYQDASEAIDWMTASEHKNGDGRFMFRIVDEDHNPIVRYAARIYDDSGKLVLLDSFAALEGYTAEQYKQVAGIDSGSNVKVSEEYISVID